MLIDTSYPDCYEDFKKEIKKLKIPQEEIRYLFLTHHHDDHAGFAASILNDTDAKLIAHENAIPHLSIGKPDPRGQYYNRRVSGALRIFEGAHDDRFPPCKIREQDVILKGDNSEVLRGLGIEGDVLFTPGHTDDHLSILLDNGDCFVGDLAMNYRLFKALGAKHFPIWYMDKDQVLKSWAKIIDRGAQNLIPSHGTPFDIDGLKRELEKRL
jgi:glyoxylase-like metal-dependent hydrolase (beta-lactamase superfamily II)